VQDPAEDERSANAQKQRKRGRIMASTNCDMCVNYIYDEDYECYTCLVNLDEDEMYRFLSGTQQACPYFRMDDEYAVVRHQM
jgi:hypothetical protein